MKFSQYTLIALLTLTLQSTTFAQDIFRFESARKIDDAVNSEYEETGPLYDPANNRLYFTRTFHPANEGGSEAGQDIWASSLSSTSWQMPDNKFSKLNNIVNNSVIGVSEDGDTLYLLGTYSPNINIQQGYSFSAKQEDGSWSKPRELNIKGLKFNGDFYGGWMHPNGKLLVLSMENKKGLGQEDLYVSQKVNGEWSKPIWLGNKINSAGFEISPFMPDDRTIIFASSGHTGLGDCDIFYSTRVDTSWTNWTTPVNMGEPINSSGFDAFPFLYEDQFYFASNRADTFNDIYVSTDLNFFELGDTMRLSFQMLETSLPDISLRVTTDKGKEVGTYTADETGRVDITGLNAKLSYLLYPEHEQVDVSLFTPYLLNANGEAVQALNKNKDGTYVAKPMSAEELQSLPTLTKPEFVKAMSGVFELDGIAVKRVLVALVDENDTPVQYASTDDRGVFHFAETPDSLKLNIQVLSQLEYLKEAGAIFYIDDNNSKLFKANKIRPGLFTYNKLQAQQLAQLKMLAKNKKPKESKGVYKYENLPQEGVTLVLLDENGTVIETVKTDENGEFVFKKLRPDQAYKIQPAEMEDGSSGLDGMVVFLDDQGNEMPIFEKTEEGTFDYKPLSSDLLSGISFMEESDGMFSAPQPKFVFSTGIFKYENLPKAGVTLKLLDENDNVIETVTTDESGHFVFSKLNQGQNYKIQVEGQTEVEVDNSQIYFVGKEGGIELAEFAGENKFNLDELKPDYFFSVSDLNEGKNQIKITESFKDVKGKFKYQDLPKEGVKLLLVDENGTVIETVYTDAEGNFHFKKLARESNFMIKMAEEDEGMMSEAAFVMTDENNQELEQEVSESGEFSFKTLPKSGSSLSSYSMGDGTFNPGQMPASINGSTEESSTANGMPQGLIPDDLKLHEVLFMFNSVRISDRDRAKLNRVVVSKLLKTSEPVLIVGYSCDIGAEVEQQEISDLRAEAIKAYLISMGIAEERIELTGLGSVIDPSTSTYEERAANRKAEILLIGG